MEEALRLAEGFGFLFDEDQLLLKGVPGGAQLAALQHWNRLLGNEEVVQLDDPVEPPEPAPTGTLGPCDAATTDT